MADILQRVFSIIVATLVFFLLPLYIAFEKKDDISYSLALSITSNFVNDVTNKGYLTIDMYNKYISDLAVTGNSYDVSLEHILKKYNPVIYVTDKNGNNQKAYDYGTYKDCIKEEENSKTAKTFKLSDGTVYYNPTISYKLSEIKYTQNQILPMIDGTQSLSENTFISGIYKIEDSKKIIYPMNIGDEFTVVIKNTNTTAATVLFNVLTFGANVDNNSKVYINYGGTIQNEEYRTTVLESYKDTKTKFDIKIYDVTNDGKVDLRDINKLKEDLNNNRITSENKEKFDLNGDRTFDEIDIHNLTLYIYDVADDGKFDENDITRLKRHLDGERVGLTKEDEELLDLNGDGKLDVKDLNIFKKDIKELEEVG